MSSDSFSEATYHAQYERALKEVRTLLDTKKHPNPSDIGSVSHRYEDKFAMAAHLTNLTISSFWQTLSLLGLTPAIFARILAWSRDGKSVRLRFTSEEECHFVKSVVREVESPKIVSETTGGFFGTTGRTDYIVTKVTDYYFEYNVSYRFVLIPGTDVDQAIPLLPKKEGTGKYNWMRNVEGLPRPSKVVNEPIDCDVTWLLKYISSRGDYHWTTFEIDRRHPECWTPRRNTCVTGALDALTGAREFGAKVEAFFNDKVWSLPDQFMSQQAPQLKRINFELFIPVIALFEATEDLTHEPNESPESQSQRSQHPLLVNLEAKSAEIQAGDERLEIERREKGPSSLLSPEESSLLIAQAERVMREKVKEFEQILSSFTLVDVTQATLVMACSYFHQAWQVIMSSVDYIEFLIRKQLVSAIGRAMTTNDFAKYLNFNFRRFYRDQYQPQTFAYSVRVPGQDSEGVVTLKSDACSKAETPQFEPAMTFVRKTKIVRPMKFKINAGTEVQFYGDRYVHGLVAHQFSTEKNASYTINGRAKQFSSFILLLGKIPAADRFDPVCAITLQNKEEIDIPLVLEAIPSAKEFKKAVESMSPEQQRFASAYRGLQLSCTLFGLVVLQINPQLERLLNLPQASLRQEIALSQQILGIFREWQVSSEVFCYDAEPNVKHTKDQQVDAVRDSVTPFLLLLEDIRRGDLEQGLIEKAIERNHTANKLFETTRLTGPPESDSPYHYCAVCRLDDEKLLVDGFYGSGQPQTKDDFSSENLRMKVIERVKSQLKSAQLKTILDKNAALLLASQEPAKHVPMVISFSDFPAYRVHATVTTGGSSGSSAFATFMVFRHQDPSPLSFANLENEVVKRVHLEFAACFHKDVIRTAKQQTFQNFFGAVIARILGKEIKVQEEAKQQRQEEEVRRLREARNQELKRLEEQEEQRRQYQQHQVQYERQYQMMFQQQDQLQYHLQQPRMATAYFGCAPTNYAQQTPSNSSFFGNIANTFFSPQPTQAAPVSYSASPSLKIEHVQRQIDAVKSVMENNIEKLLERGERLETLELRNESLMSDTMAFKRKANSKPSSTSVAPEESNSRPTAKPQDSSPTNEPTPTPTPSKPVELPKAPEQSTTTITDSSSTTQQPIQSEGGSQDASNEPVQLGKEPELPAEGRESQEIDGEPSDQEALVELSDQDEDIIQPDAEVDVTTLPTELDARFEQLDPLGWLRPTTIEIGKQWTKKVEQKMLANSSGDAPPQTLDVKQQETARDDTFLLIDALTRSGALAWHAASLHVIVAASHCFDRSLMDTVIQRNLNPCEALEHSALIIATTLHKKSAQQLVASTSYDEEKMKML